MVIIFGVFSVWTTFFEFGLVRLMDFVDLTSNINPKNSQIIHGTTFHNPNSDRVAQTILLLQPISHHPLFINTKKQ